MNTGRVNFGDQISVTGNTWITGTASLRQKVWLRDAISVKGVTWLKDKVTAVDTIDAQSNVTVAGFLKNTGSYITTAGYAGVAGTCTVVGNAEFQSTGTNAVSTPGTLNVGTALSATGSAFVNTEFSVRDRTELGSALSVRHFVQFASYFSVRDYVHLGSTLGVANGPIVLRDAVSVHANCRMGSNFSLARLRGGWQLLLYPRTRNVRSHALRLQRRSTRFGTFSSIMGVLRLPPQHPSQFRRQRGYEHGRAGWHAWRACR